MACPHLQQGDRLPRADQCRLLQFDQVLSDQSNENSTWLMTEIPAQVPLRSPTRRFFLRGKKTLNKFYMYNNWKHFPVSVVDHHR